MPLRDNNLMKRPVICLLMVFIFLNPCQAQEGGKAMKLTATEFKNNELMPKKFTCEGDDINPALIIEGAPSNTKSLALIMDDPDAPMGTWVHWVVFNIPAIRSEERRVGKEGR